MSGDVPRADVHLLRLPRNMVLNPNLAPRRRRRRRRHHILPLQQPSRIRNRHRVQILPLLEPLPQRLHSEIPRLLEHGEIQRVVVPRRVVVEDRHHSVAEVPQHVLEDVAVRVDEVGSVRLRVVGPSAGELSGEEVAAAGQCRGAGDEAAFAYLEGDCVAWCGCGWWRCC